MYTLRLNDTQRRDFVAAVFNEDQGITAKDTFPYPVVGPDNRYCQHNFQGKKYISQIFSEINLTPLESPLYSQH